MKKTTRRKQRNIHNIEFFLTLFIVFSLLISFSVIMFSFGVTVWQSTAAFYGRTPQELSNVVLGSSLALSIAVIAYKALK